jgi:hypothetical protein
MSASVSRQSTDERRRRPAAVAAGGTLTWQPAATTGGGMCCRPTALHSTLTALIPTYFFELLYCFLADCTD